MRMKTPMDEPDAAALVEQGRRLDATGDLRGAEATLRRALERIPAGPDTDPFMASMRARALTRLASLCRYDGRIPEAVDLAAGAIAAAAAAGDAVTQVEALTEAAVVALECQDVRAAAIHAGGAVTVALSIDDRRVRDGMLATALQGRAAVGRREGAHAQAERDLLEAQSYARSAYGPESLELASVLVERGVLCTTSRSFEEGVIFLRRAHGIVARTGGSRHPDLALIEHHLAVLELTRGHGAAAVTHARRSVELRTATLGPDHPATALAGVTLSASLERAGQAPRALQVLEEALPRLEASLGSGHPEVMDAHARLAALAARLGGDAAATR
jgi:tetratricopeptide (TPR) repeat protein